MNVGAANELSETGIEAGGVGHGGEERTVPTEFSDLYLRYTLVPVTYNWPGRTVVSTDEALKAGQIVLPANETHVAAIARARQSKLVSG